MEQAPAVFCHTVDIYSKKTLRAGLILHPTPVTMTSLTPYKVADAVGPDGQRLGGAVGLATYRATRLATYRTTHGFIKRVACYIWKKKGARGISFYFPEQVWAEWAALGRQQNLGRKLLRKMKRNRKILTTHVRKFKLEFF